ncbi:MAG: biotin--[acetyl-CoA-carboxylase] ligase [Bdellovibrionales bacterium]|nr:biotin--[acetyl-CoA-carboxylase] ligase [Bdellovibrionales bacterium]
MNVFESTKNWLNELKIPFMAYDQVDSTNNQAKAYGSSQAEELKVFLTDQQTHGRGRGSHSWTSPSKGSSLMISWSYRLFEPPQHITGPLFGLHLLNATKKSWPQYNWSIKPPNDLYLNDKKVAGLLVETLSQGDRFILIIGLGFNATSQPDNIEDSGHLPKQTNLNEYQWREFLNFLHAEFQHSVKKCVDPSLSNKDQNALIDALNDFPDKPDNIIDISPSGDITYANGKKLSWQDL